MAIITQFLRVLALVALVAVIVGIGGGLLVLVGWGVEAADVGTEMGLAALLITGVAFLLVVLSGMVAVFKTLGLSQPGEALGLPEGSVRAIIALMLILIFVLVAVYLNETVFTAPDTSDATQNIATALLTTVGTLVVAVAGFYFGTGSVKTAAAALREPVSEAPTAFTKGSTDTPTGWELVGRVNPHDHETRYYFEYGTDTSYGQATSPPPTALTGNAEVEVRTVALPTTEINTGHHFRLVAFNDAGTAYGEDSAIGGPS